MTRAAPLSAVLLLAACSGAGDVPGTTSADEDRQLNEAAEMLDANSVSLNALGEDDGPDGEGTSDQPGGPQE